MATPDITGSGGYIPPVPNNGYIRGASGIPYFDGLPFTPNIPGFQRLYSIGDKVLAKIQEGRSNMSRLLLGYAKANGAYKVNDIQHRWLIETKRHPRYYIKAGTYTVTNGVSKFKVEVADSKRIQSGDQIILMFSFVTPARDCQPVIAKDPLTAKVVPETCRVIDVDYSTGTITCERNFAGDKRGTATPAAPATVKVVASVGEAATDEVALTSAFFLRSTNSLPEGIDDQKIFSSTPTWDYNYCQYVMRKWGTTDIQEHVKKLGQSESTMKRNRREAVETFFDEDMEWSAIFGSAKEEIINGRWRGYAGGLLETIPTANVHKMTRPAADFVDMGDFQLYKFNKFLENKFYFGSQDKIVLAGVNWHTAFATMITKVTTAVAQKVETFGVSGISYSGSNGGRITVVPSDKLSLNGMEDYALCYDPSTFQYGHLEGMDISIVEKLPSTNIHEDMGEIYGVITYLRSNPNANHLFVLA